MSYINDHCASEAVGRQSLDWLVLLTSGRVTVGDAQAFQAWRAQSAAHALAFREALELRQKLQIAAAELSAAEKRAGNVIPWSSGGGARVSRRAMLGGAIAASAVGLVVGGTQTGLLPTVAEIMADYHTATGQQKTVAFARGIAFQLNTQTSLSVRSQRAVEVLTGEVSFEAQLPGHDALSVVAKNGTIQASDASFNVRNTEGSVCVSCVRGRLTVANGGQSVRLKPGQQVQYAEGSWSGVRAVNIGMITAWRSGVVMFHDLALRDVIHEVNRYRPGKVLITDRRLNARKFSGLIQIKRPEAILAQLQSLGVRITSLPGGIVLVS